MSDDWRRVAVAGHEGDEAVARAALAADDPQTRVLALGALARMGALSTDDLRVASTDAEAGVRHRVALLAATHPDMSVLALLGDGEATVVEAAAWAAGEQEAVGDDVLAVLIDSATAAADPLVREACVAALGAIGDERGLPAVLAGCADKPAIRRRAVLALSPFDGPEVISAWRAALEDRDWQVRQAAEDLAPFMSDD
jgi:HEAT repeat protein